MQTNTCRLTHAHYYYIIKVFHQALADTKCNILCAIENIWFLQFLTCNRFEHFSRKLLFFASWLQYSLQNFPHKHSIALWCYAVYSLLGNSFLIIQSGLPWKNFPTGPNEWVTKSPAFRVLARMEHSDK